MKTNQIMIRDNKAFIQRTKDSYFNANALLNNWNQKNDKKLQLGNYKKNNQTKLFIAQLIKEGIDKPLISGRGKLGETWMHPKLFIDFAMWVSIEFKSLVIDYVLDGLIQSLNDAGDYYNQMCAQILESYINYYNRKPPAYIYQNEAKLVRSFIVCKDRNKMSEQELKQLTYLQKVNANLIKKGIGKQARINRLKEASEIEI